MSSIIGEQIKISLFGESHGKYVGVTLHGLPGGIKIDYDFLNRMMKKRKSIKELSTSRNEKDKVLFISGVFNGYTTGTPLTILIKNNNQNSSEYENMKSIARPGQIDYVAYLKYHGFQDYRGSGHFSGRLTAPLVAIGSIALSILQRKGIKIGSHLYAVHNIEDTKLKGDDLEKEINKWNNSTFPTINNRKAKLMKDEIINAKQNGDSLGGIVETVILTNDITIGEPFFDSLESKLSEYIFSIGGIKGIEFGYGFEFSKKLGSEVKDEWQIKDGKIQSTHNYNGGINGGISNHQPIIFRCVFKPTSSIKCEQKTVDFINNKNVTLSLKGRHDPAIVHRGLVVINALTALALLDLCAIRYGNEWLR